jgi:hypothetical protein
MAKKLTQPGKVNTVTVKKEEVFTKKEIDSLPTEVLDGMTSYDCPECNGAYKSPCVLCEGQGSIFYRNK